MIVISISGPLLKECISITQRIVCIWNKFPEEVAERVQLWYLKSTRRGSCIGEMSARCRQVGPAPTGNLYELDQRTFSMLYGCIILWLLVYYWSSQCLLPAYFWKIYYQAVTETLNIYSWAITEGVCVYCWFVTESIISPLLQVILTITDLMLEKSVTMNGLLLKE